MAFEKRDFDSRSLGFEFRSEHPVPEDVLVSD